MFICQECFRSSKPHDTCNKVVVERRKMMYKNSKGKTSEGWEVAKEASLCTPCFVEHRKGGS